MRIEITFHGPFRIATGRAHQGAAVTVDRTDVLPASSLKGVMRASATMLLPGHEQLVTDVFGGPGRPSPWHWSSATPCGPPEFEQRARIAIDPDTGAVRSDFLAVGEEVWANTAIFDITRHRHLDPATHARHHTVLACAAAGVHALGGNRRRGLGWVSLRPLDPPLDEAVLAAFEDLLTDSPRTPPGGRHA